MIWSELPIILLFLAGLFGLTLLIGALFALDKSNEWLKLLQALFTILALGISAYWYFAERKGEPHADISQTVHTVLVGDGLVGIEVHVTLKNLGQRLLEVDAVNSRLQRIEPDTYDYQSLSREQSERYWSAQRPNDSGDHFHLGELRWPVHEKYNDRVRHSIEPGETDLFVVTFLYRCGEIQKLRVATDVVKPTSDEGEVLAWKARNFVDVAPLCIK